MTYDRCVEVTESTVWIYETEEDAIANWNYSGETVAQYYAEEKWRDCDDFYDLDDSEQEKWANKMIESWKECLFDVELTTSKTGDYDEISKSLNKKQREIFEKEIAEQCK